MVPGRDRFTFLAGLNTSLTLSWQIGCMSKGIQWKLIRLIVCLAAVSVFTTACSGEAESAAPEVATLDTEDSAVGDAADAAIVGDNPELAPDEAALEFSACMREQGLDFPDLAVDAEGNIDLRAAFQTVDRQSEDFPAAMDACREVLADTGFGGGARQALQSPELQDAFVDFSACVRDGGFDVGDLTLPGRGGPGAPADGEDADARNDGVGDESEEDRAGQTPGAGQRRGGFGTINERLAAGLGLDYEDENVQATVDECAVIIEEALTAVGLGGAVGGASDQQDEAGE